MNLFELLNARDSGCITFILALGVFTVLFGLGVLFAGLGLSFMAHYGFPWWWT